MATDRYVSDSILAGGAHYGTAKMTTRIRRAVKNNTLSVVSYIMHENERLDHVAGKAYNDGSLWWVIAAASNIGWGLQIPAGTVVLIPNQNELNALFG